MEQPSSPKSASCDTMLCRLYVRNINRTTTNENLQKYFEKFGQLSDTSLIMDQSTGQNKGYAFITFDNDKCVDDCLLAAPHNLDDRELEVRRVMPKSIPDPLLQNKTCRIFLGGLPHGVSDQDIIDFFNGKYSNLGEVKEVIIKKERQSGRPRGFCFVEFTSYHVVDKIVTDNRFPVIMNKKCEVRKADTAVPITGAPPSSLPPTQQNGHLRNGPMIPNRGSGYDHPGRYGESRYGPRNDSAAPYSSHHHHYPSGGSAHHPYGNSGYDDGSSAAINTGYGGGYYNSYSSYASQYGQPYGGPPPMERPYSHSSYPPSGGYGSGYDSQPVIPPHRQQSAGAYSGNPMPISNPSAPQSDYNYQSSVYGATNSSSGPVGPTSAPVGAYGANPASAPPPQPGSSTNYGASYGGGGHASSSLVGQTVAYPTRSAYRAPPGSNPQSTQGSVGSSMPQSVGGVPGPQHRPTY